MARPRGTGVVIAGVQTAETAEELPAPEYPFIVNVDHPRDHWHGRSTITRRLEGRPEFAPPLEEARMRRTPGQWVSATLTPVA